MASPAARSAIRATYPGELPSLTRCLLPLKRILNAIAISPMHCVQQIMPSRLSCQAKICAIAFIVCYQCHRLTGTNYVQARSADAQKVFQSMRVTTFKTTLGKGEV